MRQVAGHFSLSHRSQTQPKQKDVLTGGAVEPLVTAANPTSIMKLNASYVQMAKEANILENPQETCLAEDWNMNPVTGAGNRSHS